MAKNIRKLQTELENNMKLIDEVSISNHFELL